MSDSGMSESALGKLVQIEATASGIVLMRNQSGGFKDANGRFVYFGLGHTTKGNEVGSSDFVGWRKVNLPDGRAIAQFVAVEIKRPGGHTDPKRLAKQENFIAQVHAAGGLALFVRSVDEARKAFASGGLLNGGAE